MLGLNKILLNNIGFKEEIKKRNQNISWNKWNGNTTYQNLWGAAKAVVKGKLIVINAYIKKQERPKINNLTFHPKELGEEEQIKPKVTRRKEITKIRVTRHEIETKQTVEKFSEELDFWVVKQ